jgi:hypothetical protein
MTQHQIERRAEVRAELNELTQVMRDIELSMAIKAKQLVRQYGAPAVASAHARMMRPHKDR